MCYLAALVRTHKVVQILIFYVQKRHFLGTSTDFNERGLERQGYSIKRFIVSNETSIFLFAVVTNTNTLEVIKYI
jgi:hypothetical protein